MSQNHVAWELHRTLFQETTQSSPSEKEKQLRWVLMTCTKYSFCTFLKPHNCAFSIHRCWTCRSSGGKWETAGERKALYPIMSWMLTMNNLTRCVPCGKNTTAQISLSLVVWNTDLLNLILLEYFTVHTRTSFTICLCVLVICLFVWCELNKKVTSAAEKKATKIFNVNMIRMITKCKMWLSMFGNFV